MLQMIRRIELHPRFGGPHLEQAARARLVRARREAQLAGRLPVQCVVVVVAVAEPELVVGDVDVAAKGLRLAEVERSAFHRAQLAGRDQRVVHRQEMVGVHRDHVAEVRHGGVAGEIEERVVGEVRHRRLVLRGGSPFDDELVAVGDQVAHRDRQGAGIVLLAVLEHVAHLDRVVGELARGEDLEARAVLPAVQAVRAVVGGEQDVLPVEREPGAADAIGIL